MEIYNFQDKFDFADYVFQNKENHSIFPVLCGVSNSNDFVGGFCRYSSVADVCTTQRIIFEATLPPNESNYFGNHFTHRLSDQQLTNTKFNSVNELLSYMTYIGVTTAAEFLETEKRLGASSIQRLYQSSREDVVNEFDGCRRFTVDGMRFYPKPTLAVTVEDIESDSADACTTHIKMHGPVVGVFFVDRDYHDMCNVAMYEPNQDAPVYDDSGRRYAHSVMLTGYGIAQHRVSNLQVPYFRFQNNWGKKKSITGRLPCHLFLTAYAPRLNKECNLVEFLANDGSDSMRMVKLEDLKDRI